MLFNRLFVFLILVTSISVHAETEKAQSSNFYGEDGMLDVSGFLKEKYGFFVMPTIITSPALGTGGGLNFIYLHDKLAGKIDPETGRYLPPSMSGAALIGTENGTRVGGAFHIGFYQKDTLRTTTFIGVPDVNINFYPNNSFLPRELKVEMNLKGYAAYQDIKFRLGDTAWFLGGDYTYSTLDTQPKNNTGFDSLDRLLNVNSTIHSFSAKALYDTRNSIFSPDKGLFAQIRATRSASDFGNQSSEYSSYTAKTFYFHPLSEKVFMGYRLEGTNVDGSAPFYTYPFIDIRGIPAMRYQGQNVVMAEIESKIKMTPRFGLILFAGSGTAFGQSQLQSETDFSESEWQWGKGLGLRYTISSAFKMDVGFDYAFGPEDNYFYLQFGSAWNGWF